MVSFTLIAISKLRTSGLIDEPTYELLWNALEEYRTKHGIA